MTLNMKQRLNQRDWVDRNIERMMLMIMKDVRHGLPLPRKITMSSLAYGKFIDALKSKSAYFPDREGNIDFVHIPVKLNPQLPNGTFVIERFGHDRFLLKAR